MVSDQRHRPAHPVRARVDPEIIHQLECWQRGGPGLALVLVASLALSVPLALAQPKDAPKDAGKDAKAAKPMPPQPVKAVAAKLAADSGLSIEITPVSGEDVQKLIARIYATPAEVVERLLKPGN